MYAELTPVPVIDAHRILYGSDYPHIPYDMETEVRAIVGMNLGEECLRKILCDNAARLFSFQVRGDRVLECR